MHKMLVEKRKWISNDRFRHALNYWHLLPGPEAQQLATYIGWLLNGALSGITAAVVGVVLNLSIWFGVLLAALSFLAMRYGKFGMISVLAACSGLGSLWKIFV